MNDEPTKSYDLLGVSPGASLEEVKVAYRDLAKVWHPDRFIHDPRLQQKAEEKLKEINKAYDQFRAKKTQQQTPASASTSERHTPPRAEHYTRHARTGSIAVLQRTRWQLILVSVLVFAAVFLVTSRSLLRSGEREHQAQIPPIKQASYPPDPERQQPDSNVNTAAPDRSVNAAASEFRPGQDRMATKAKREGSGLASASQPSATRVRALPTVTIVIDPSSGMIARSTCPMKTTMTYPSGSEPHQYCTLHRAATIAPAPAPSDSRLKSVGKRLSSPSRWFGGNNKEGAANRQDSKSP